MESLEKVFNNLVHAQNDSDEEKTATSVCIYGAGQNIACTLQCKEVAFYILGMHLWM